MKTLTEIKKDSLTYRDYTYTEGYEDAIEGILKDIQDSSTISVESIEKYLTDLLK